MHIFIDESGSFQVADKTPSPSVVGALIIPDHKLDELLVNYAKLRRKIWPRGGEVKGRQLSELHVAEVIKMLRCHSVLFEAVVVEMGMHTVDGLKAHQASLADGLTRNLTPQHHENTHKGAARLRAELEAMKLPGFVQSTANFQLLREVYTHIPNYFAQRFPRELAQFKWVVDGKEPMVDATPWEKWWSFVMFPYLQASSLRQPAGFLKDADWSHFAPLLHDEIPEYLLPHIEPSDRPRMSVDLRKVFGDFRFSTDAEPGLELVDIVTNGLRRAMVGHLQKAGWIGMPDLMIRRRDQNLTIISMNGIEPPPKLPYADVIQHFKGVGREMLTAPRR
jgi:hypothetical protein